MRAGFFFEPQGFLSEPWPEFEKKPSSQQPELEKKPFAISGVRFKTIQAAWGAVKNPGNGFFRTPMVLNCSSGGELHNAMGVTVTMPCPSWGGVEVGGVEVGNGSAQPEI